MKKNKGMTRRQFLRNAAFGAAGLAALGFFGSRLFTSKRVAAENGEMGPAAANAAATGIKTNPFDLTKRTVLLNNGVEMPILGLGTFGLNNTQAENSAYWALKAGHRLIDTASAYNNEAAVGRGIKRAIDEGIVKREEIFVTTKLWPMGGYNAGGIDAALQKLGLEYIDLMLLHQPFGDYIGAYKAMEEAVAAGKLCAIGISNFSAAQIEEIMAIATILPAVQQVETHLYHQQGTMMEYLNNYGTVLEAWFPLGGRGNTATFFDIPEVQEIAAAHGKLPVQVIIRWHLQSGHVCIPGSINEAHIQENANVFDFELTADEMAKLNALNKNAPYYKGMGGNEEENRAILEAMEERWGLNQGE